MRGSILCLCTVLLLSVGCGKSNAGAPDGGGGPCAAQRACPTACSHDTDCSGGQVCAQGVCANPPPTSTSYDRCYLDSDCNPGDHCTVGVCAHDCTQDSDCAGGEVCTDRGRCVTPSNVGKEPPPETPAGARLTVLRNGKPVDALDFGDSVTRDTITVQNTGGGELEVWLLSNQPYFKASPARVRLGAQESQRIDLTLDRSTATASEAVLDVRSSAGDVTVPVLHVQRLSGRFQGHISLTGPVDLGGRDFVVELDQTAGGQALTGAVDATVSPPFLVNDPVEQGSVTPGNNETDVSFELRSVAGAHSAINPYFALPIEHDYQFVGKVTGAQQISGTVTDQIHGIYANATVDLTGTFTLTRVGDRTSLAAAPAPTFTPGQVTAPSFPACTTCPAGGTCGSAGSTQLTDAFLDASFPFYAAYMNQGSNGIPLFGFDNGNSYEDVATYCGIHPCLALPNALCALKYAAAQGQEDAFLDVAKGISAFFTLRSSDQVASTMMADAQSPGAMSLSQVETSLQQAATLAGYALHLRGSTLDQNFSAPLDPWSLAHLRSTLASKATWMSRLPVVLVNGGNSCTGSTSPVSVSVGAGLERLVEALEARLFAQRAALHAQERLEKTTADRTAVGVGARRAITGGELDAAILADLYVVANQDPTGVFVKVRQSLRALRSIYDEVSSGRNAVGMPPDLTILERTSDPSLSDYEVIRDQAKAAIQRWTAALGTALTDRTDLEHDQAMLKTGVEDLQTNVETQLTDICGKDNIVDSTSGDILRCGADSNGKPEGQYAVAAQELSKAYVRIQMAQNDLGNLQAKIDIEKRRFKAIQGVDLATIAMVDSTNRQIKLEDQQQAQVKRMEAQANAFGGLINGLGEAVANPGAGLAAMLASVVSCSAQMSAADQDLAIQQARDDIQTDQQIHFIQAGMKKDAINHAAAVETLLLDEANLELSVVLAAQDSREKLLEVKNLLQKAVSLARISVRQQANLACGVMQDPSLHLSMTAALDRAEAAATDARYWVYLSARAFEYDANVSAGDPEAIFAAASPTELGDVLAVYEGNWAKGGYWVKPQEYRDANPFSLRKILGIDGPVTDSVTGKQVSAAEQFRRYLFAPENWQPDGSLKLTFSTLPGQPAFDVFSTKVYDDRVNWIAVGLVGDQLGDSTAKVTIEQSGLNALETADGKTYNYYHLATAGYRAAGAASQNQWTPPESQKGYISAGVNIDLNTAAQTNSPYASIEFQGRAVRAGSWSVIFDPNDPDNTDVDLSTLDDIQLLFDHRALTVQSGP